MRRSTRLVNRFAPALALLVLAIFLVCPVAQATVPPPNAGIGPFAEPGGTPVTVDGEVGDSQTIDYDGLDSPAATRLVRSQEIPTERTGSKVGLPSSEPLGIGPFAEPGG